MNEQILEQYKQSLQFAYLKVPKEYWNTDNFHSLVAGKFAELIVRECIDWCNAHATIDGTAQKIVESIKKDFGVEE